MYFTRICLAKSLRDIGYPFDVKVSLLTRERSEAVIRNIDVAVTLKNCLNRLMNTTLLSVSKNHKLRKIFALINVKYSKFMTLSACFSNIWSLSAEQIKRSSSESKVFD